MTPEGKVRAYLKRRIKELGGTHRKLQWIGRVGAPDEVAWWPGKSEVLWFVDNDGNKRGLKTTPTPVLGFFECKRPKGGKLSVMQEREIARMRQDGFNVYVTHTEQAIDEALKDLLRDR